MRQRIPFKQWSELSEKKKIKWLDAIYFGKENTYKTFKDYFNDRSPEYEWSVSDEIKHQENSFGDFTEGLDIDLPNIGQMIEFLGDDWWKSLFVTIYDDTVDTFERGELCNELWNLVKRKLIN